tara:strand:+ start:13083 stop:14315 length:1233 start_codon:yes stop_codon:yes gene_type:complete
MGPRIILLITILFIFLIPTFNIGGVPVRLEDIFFIGILIFIKNKSNLNSNLYSLLFLIIISNIASIYIQILRGYSPVLGDLNTIFSLFRNLLIVHAGFLIGQNLKIKSQNLIKLLSLGFFISVIASLIQYYDIAGYGQELFLIYGKEKELEYGLSRAIGTAGNPNYAAFFQLNALIALLILWRKVSLNYIIFILFLLAIITSIFITFSRTGLICIALIFLVNLLIEKRYIMLFLFAFVAFASFPFFSNLSENTRFESLIGSENGNSNTDILTLNGRVDGIWKQKVDMLLNNPLLGTSSAKGLRSTTDFNNITFDNSYLYILVTGGIIGFLLYVLYYYYILKIFRQKHRYKNDIIAKYIILLHLNIFVFYFTTDLIIVVEFTTFYFFIVGIFLNETKNDETTSFNSDIKLE